MKGAGEGRRSNLKLNPSRSFLGAVVGAGVYMNELRAGGTRVRHQTLDYVADIVEGLIAAASITYR